MEISDAIRTLDRDLRELFGARLQSLVAYPASFEDRDGAATLAIVDRVTPDDLRACADRVAAWHDAGLATPLLLAGSEFGRSLDAFPFEFGEILADHVVVSGANPFDGLRVEPGDLRRACEVQARSHLLHLREGFIEAGSRSDAVAALIRQSSAPLAALLKNVARLRGLTATTGELAARALQGELGTDDGTLARVVRLSASSPLTSDEARRIFPSYLEAIERLTRLIDRWTS